MSPTRGFQGNFRIRLWLRSVRSPDEDVNSSDRDPITGFDGISAGPPSRRCRAFRADSWRFVRSRILPCLAELPLESQHPRAHAPRWAPTVVGKSQQMSVESDLLWDLCCEANSRREST